jgi:hypothetical protein
MHDIDVQTTKVNEWHHYLFHLNLWKRDFVQLLLSNRDPLNLWWNNKPTQKVRKNDNKTYENEEDEIMVCWP